MTTSDIYSITYDVIIVGGGVTGAGTARDCAMRGLKVLLVERNDYSTGATGRNHGLMHSGARYAVTDGESAAECIAENRVMRTIARHCIEPTDGLFITLPDDDLQYQDTFVTACRNAGIDAQAIDPAEALQLDPAVNPDIIGAVRVPDASIDPFRLTVANLLDARLHGAVTLNYHEVEGVVTSQDRVEGVKLFNKLDGTRAEVHGHVVVNAAGIWGHRLASMAGVDIPMFPARGALLIFGPRINRMVINRCRKPSNGDILVPDGTVSVLGTTSDRIPIEAIDDMRVTREEVDTLLTEGAKLSPQLTRTRIIRAYAGVRPLVASDDDPSGRSISRGMPGPRPARRPRGPGHHHRRQDDHLPTHGTGRHRRRVRQTGQHGPVHYCRPTAARLRRSRQEPGRRHDTLQFCTTCRHRPPRHTGREMRQQRRNRQCPGV